MKYLKDYNKNEIEIGENYCWIINGDGVQVLTIMYKFYDIISNEYKNEIRQCLNILGNSIYSIYKNMYKIYIYYTDLGFSYWAIQNQDDEEFALNNMDFCLYQGELKIEDHNLVLDTFGCDIKKYNL